MSFETAQCHRKDHLHTLECVMPRAEKVITWMHMPGFVVIETKDHLRALAFCRHGRGNDPVEKIQHLGAPLACEESNSITPLASTTVKERLCQSQSRVLTELTR